MDVDVIGVIRVRRTGYARQSRGWLGLDSAANASWGTRSRRTEGSPKGKPWLAVAPVNSSGVAG